MAMEHDLATLKEAGLDTATGIGFTGNEEKYISAVQRFYRNHEKNSAKLKEFYEAKDYENYCITVHALKSNARMIGADGLSKLFEELEKAAKEGDTDTIERKTASALSEYACLIGKLEPVEGHTGTHPLGGISAEEARRTADKLLLALDDYDDELSKELALKLSRYPFRITQSNKLTEASGYIDDFLYDEAAELIREIYPGIE